MALRFARSAGKHRVSHERIAYVIRHCGLPFDAPEEDDDLVLFLGDDWNGVPLEVAAVEVGDGDLLVIHAMALRRKYHDLYQEAQSWRR